MKQKDFNQFIESINLDIDIKSCIAKELYEGKYKYDISTTALVVVLKTLQDTFLEMKGKDCKRCSINYTFRKSKNSKKSYGVPILIQYEDDCHIVLNILDMQKYRPKYYMTSFSTINADKKFIDIFNRIAMEKYGFKCVYREFPKQVFDTILLHILDIGNNLVEGEYSKITLELDHLDDNNKYNRLTIIPKGEK